MKGLLPLCSCLIAVTLAGCAPRDPLTAWQRRVDRYIRTHGKGNIDTLRDVARARSRHAERPARVTFGELNTPGGKPGSQYDAMGILLGYRRVAEHNWYVFLVGVTKVPPQDKPRADQRVVVDDVRLVAVSATTGRLKWIVSEPDPTSLARYRRGRDAHAVAESCRSLFPGTFDLYELRVIGQTIRATEKRSGASWQVAVPSSHRRESFQPSAPENPN